MRKGERLKIWFYPKPWSSWRPTWRATTQPLSWSRPSVWWTCASSAKGSGCRDTGPTRWSTCALCSRNKPAHRTSRTRYTTPLRMASILQHSTWSFHRNFTDRFFDYKKERKKKIINEWKDKDDFINFNSIETKRTIPIRPNFIHVRSIHSRAPYFNAKSIISRIYK